MSESLYNAFLSKGGELTFGGKGAPGFDVLLPIRVIC